MQTYFHISLGIYLLFYAFEAPIRYAFHMLGKDELIFVRDIIIFLPVLLLFIVQFVRQQIHPAFMVFGFIIALHGLIMILNLHSMPAVIYATKMFATMLVGALVASCIFEPSRSFIRLCVVLWLTALIGICLDKYFLEFFWSGMQANVGGVEVDISRDWMVEGEDKRAAGFMRSSINAAIFVPMLAILLIYHLRSTPLRISIALLTLPLIYWTTQKGAILAYAITLACIFMSGKHRLFFLKAGFIVALLLAVCMPVILPEYKMPHVESGVFTLSSMVMRIEEVWPDAWNWINRNQVFPFGVGLGGIGGAQRFYAPDQFNFADNIFLLLYANFGLMTFVYLALVTARIISLPSVEGYRFVQPLAMLVFLLLYGIAISILEDQAGTLFAGAALAWIYRKYPQAKTTVTLAPEQAKPLLISGKCESYA